MLSKFNKNCIYTGVVDSFCLSCQTHLKSIHLNDHIETSEHLHSLGSMCYAQKFKENLIWKTNQGYYCEMCNMVIQTTAKVHIHVAEQVHINNKIKSLIKGYKDGAIVFDEIYIEMKAWQGLCNESCIICNVDFDDEKKHVDNPQHIINLIQSKFELIVKKSVFRKISNDVVNCLICNTIIQLESKEAHIEDPKHLKEYSKCRELMKKIESDNHVENNITEANEKSTLEPNNDNTNKSIVEKTDISDGEGMKSDDTVSNIEKDQTASEESMSVVLPLEAMMSAKKFAKQHHLKYKRNSSYCQVCNVRISSSLKMMQEHVSEESHKRNLINSRQSVQNTIKIPMFNFVITLAKISNLFHQHLVLNDEICITKLSFEMVGETKDRLRCHACEVSFEQSQLEQHTEKYAHKKAMQVTPVLSEFKTELIREVREGIFHCGFCNLIEAGLDGMANHLKCSDHYETKMEYKRHLHRYLPEIIESRERQQLFRFMQMFQNML